MNVKKWSLGIALLLVMLWMSMVSLPGAAEVGENLFKNGVLTDANNDGKPDDWIIYGDAAFVRNGDTGYVPPTGWTGNYVLDNQLGNRGIQQEVSHLIPGQLYKLSALYTSTTDTPVWDITLMYFSEESVTALKNNTNVTLAFNNSVKDYTWTALAFKGTTTPMRSEYVFKLPEIASGTLPEGASIGLRVRVRTAGGTGGAIFKVTDFKLEVTENWVANGHFENDLAGWTTMNSPEVDRSCNAPEGTGAARLDLNDSDQMDQKIYLDGGKTYRVRFKYNAERPQGTLYEGRLAVLDSDASKYYAHFTQGGNVADNSIKIAGWRTCTYYFTPAESESNITLRLSTWNTHPDTKLYFDDIEITEVKGQGDAALYNPTNGTLLEELPEAGEKLLFRGVSKTTKDTDSANVLFALYKLCGDSKQLVKVTLGGGEEQAQITHHTNTQNVKTNFIEVRKEFTMPDMPDSNASYMIQAFLVKDMGSLTALDEPAVVLQTANAVG